MNKKNKKEFLRISIYLLVAIAFLVLCIIQTGKPISSDQLYFAYTARAIVNTGIPEMHFAGYGLEPLSGLAHPPLYINLLALSVKIFGYNLFGMKIVSILFALATSAVLFFFTKKLYPDKKYLGLIAAGIYLLHPFVIQNSLILDIDGGVLSFFTIFALLYFVKYKLEKPFILGILLLGVTFTKFTSIIILAGVIISYLLFFEKDKLKNLLKAILILAAVISVFIILFYFYSLLVQGDFFKVFTQNTSEKFLQRFSENFVQSVARTAYSLKDFIIWLTPPMFLYLIIILFMDIKGIIRKNLDIGNKVYFLFFIISIAFFALTGIDYIGFAKHYIIIVPILAIIMAKDIEENKRKIDSRTIMIILVSSLIMFNYFYFVVGDPFFTPDVWMVYQNFDYSVIFAVAIKMLLIAFPALILFFILELKARRALIITSLVFLVYATVYTASVSYATNIHYGDCCTQEAVDYVENLTGGRNATILSLHQFSFIYNKGGDYSEVRNSAYMYPAGKYYLDKNYLSNVNITPGNTYLVIYDQDRFRRPDVKEDIESKFDLVNQIGYYQVYKYKN